MTRRAGEGTRMVQADEEGAVFTAYRDLVEQVRDRTDLEQIKAELYARMRAQDHRTGRSRSDARPLAELRFLTVAEVAERLRVSKLTVYRMVHRGELSAIKVGRGFRVPEQQVHDFLNANECEAM